jgi:GntR family transcriptional regulator
MAYSRIPKYEIIEQDIINDIRTGKLQPGDKVSGESQLKKKYGVSAITVRKAFDELINNGYLVGVQGTGTFVAKKQMIRGLTSISFSDELKQQGYKTDMNVIEIKTVMDERIAGKMGVPSDALFTYISRVRLANNEKVAFHISYFLNSQLNEEQAKLIYKTRSLYEMIAQYHLYPVLVNENYSVKEITDTKICRQLDVKKNYPSFFVKRTTFDSNNNIIEYAETYFNKDFYSTTVNIRKD